MPLTPRKSCCPTSRSPGRFWHGLARCSAPFLSCGGSLFRSRMTRFSIFVFLLCVNCLEQRVDAQANSLPHAYYRSRDVSFGDAERKPKAYISYATSISSLFRVLPQTALSDAPRTTSRTYLPTYGLGNDYLRQIEKGAVVHRLGSAFVKCLP
jgi:hypothetical protein